GRAFRVPKGPAADRPRSAPRTWRRIRAPAARACLAWENPRWGAASFNDPATNLACESRWVLGTAPNRTRSQVGIELRVRRAASCYQTRRWAVKSDSAGPLTTPPRRRARRGG